jgi:hypothetical protein
VKIEAGAERYVNVLLDLIASRVSYVDQEAVVAMKVYSFVHMSAHAVITFRAHNAFIHCAGIVAHTIKKCVNNFLLVFWQVQ